MKTIFILAISALVTYGTCFAQAEYLPTPPSVESRTFLQNINYPVSYYTGTVNVEIPIFTISLKDFKLPVSLTYNTSGIKVEQESSTVGLGWVLNGNGVISKTIMGENDLFRPYTYFNASCSGSPHIDCNDLSNIKGIYNPSANHTLSDYLWGGAWFWSGSQEVIFNALSNSVYAEDIGGREFAPDLFNYNFCGYSGNFIFNRQKQILKEKEDDVEITPKFDRNGDISSWTATAPDGTRFYFEKTEKVQYKSTWSCNSSWYVTRIETPGGSRIDFEYKTTSRQYWAFSRYQETDNNGINADGFTLKHQMYNDCLYLDRISFNGGSLAFFYVFDRKDAKWLPRLASVRRYDHADTNIATWHLEQSYFNATELNNDLPTVSQIQYVGKTTDYDNDWNTKRLKLDSVCIQDPATGESNSYVLTYNNSKLPTKLSAGTDHWGYYNGRSNTTLIGETWHNISDGNTIELAGYNGADREAYDQFNQAFMLTGVKYPTGGQTLFTYESNQYLTSNLENDHHKESFYYGNEKTTIEEPDYYKNVPSDFINKQTVWVPSSAGPYEKPLMIEYYVEVNCDTYRYRYSPDLSFTLSLVKNGSPVWSRKIKVPELPPANGITEENNKFKGVDHVRVPYGEYEMQVTGSLRKMNDKTRFTVSRYSMPDEYMSKTPFRNGGGLRIREIVSSSESNQNQLAKKTFRYSTVTYDDWTKKTGKLMSFPRYNTGYNKYCSNGLRNSGYSVGYSRVFVSDASRDGRSNGTIEYEYINKPDSNLYYRWTVKDSRTGRVIERSIDENPGGVGPLRFPENGTLLSETYYNAINSRVKRIEYEYDFLGGAGNMVWGVAKNYSKLSEDQNRSYLTQSQLNAMKNVLLSSGYQQGIPMGYLYPAIIPTRVFLKKQREITNTVSPMSSIEHVTEYKYHRMFNNFVTKIIETDGGIDTLVIEKKYPFDYTDATMVALTEKNRISIPIETRTYKNGELTLLQENNYGFFPLYTDAPLLSGVRHKTEESAVWVPDVTYSNYDKYGNPQQVTVKSVDAVYLWSYQGQYPVLKVENATLTQVKTALGVSADALIASLAQKSDLSDADFELLNSLRISLPKSMVTVCRYKPGIGVVSITDSRAVITEYSYDNFGRLTRVLEKADGSSEGNTVSAYRYNYAK